MAAAIPKFRVQTFTDALALQKYVVDTTSPVNSIVSIVFDAASGKYVLFYLVA